MALLKIASLEVHFKTPSGIVRAVDGVDLTARQGEVLGIVGESGCGKSVLALSILRLLPMPPAFFAGGKILFEDRNLLAFTNDEIRGIRGNRISMIFQEPMTALNPVFTVGNQLAEVYRIHRHMHHSQALRKSVAILEKVGIPAPEKRVNDYPHQLSGGLRQRVMIAMARACRPRLLIADEPTTALDVTIQAQILDLLLKLKDDFATAIIIITHDLGVIAETTDSVMVMYTGRVMETASTVDLFDHPLHPYTRGLLRAIPSATTTWEDGELYEITGRVPSLLDLPPGCNFNTRCPEAEDICRRKEPELREIHPGHRVACWKIDHAQPA
jgi:oligopeptide/dipeptide ABC transporter ATP-binding protein